MSWFAVLPALLVSLAVIMLPGLLVGWFLRLRGLWLAAIAPVISITLLVIASIVLPMLGQRWAPLPVFVFVAVAGALVVVLFRYVLRTSLAPSEADQEDSAGRGSRLSLASWAAWLIGACIACVCLMVGVGAPDAISQTYDNIYHLNLVAFINETGNASALVAGRVSVPLAEIVFYPNAWHMLVSLTQVLSGATIPVAINAINLAILIAVWSTGTLVLVRLLVGRSVLVLIATGAMLGALPVFPLNLLRFGVLYPSFLGFSLVPVVFAIVLLLLGIGKQSLASTRLGLVVLLLGSLPAITLAHPSAMMVVLAFSLPAVAVVCFKGWRSWPKPKQRLRLLAFVAFAAFGLVMLVVVRAGSFWNASKSLLEGLWQVLSLSMLGYGLPLVLAALVIVGLVVALRKASAEDVVLVGVWLVGAVLFFIALSIDFRPVRSLLVGVWYSDPPRLAALFAIAVIPIAVRGVVGLSELPRLSKLFAPKLLATTLVVLFAGVYLTAGWPQFLEKLREAHTVSDDSLLLSGDEIRLLERLPELVPEDSVIVGNPWTGTGLAYALAERDVIEMHVNGALTDDAMLIIDRLRWAGAEPAVCDAIIAEQVGYVLDFGRLEVHGDRHPYPGIENLSSSPAVELVAEEGDARLYRVVACGLG